MENSNSLQNHPSNMLDSNDKEHAPFNVGEKLLDNAFAVEDEDLPFNWRDYGIEDILVFCTFWILAGVVFAQFFSRYVLGQPLAWSEEVARYLLVCVTFLGAIIGVRRNSHIFIELFHRYLPSRVSVALFWVVDVIRVLFFVVLAWSAYKILPMMGHQTMTSVPVPVSYLYGVILFSLVIMVLRSLQHLWIRVRRN
ncbi:TRAP transporter small permease [Pseudomonas sp. MS19]|uniref:TRAP transporter small permease n=1 Tax=Pseudomonas sp. MS19 TaxID=2579939 RepID=UPI00156232B6|nr:TRAP transporter small permease [Pseudomonas sp. MS19]NRH26458.1 TRAP transporter small permease [Pseudomonas sp. MS19]